MHKSNAGRLHASAIGRLCAPQVRSAAARAVDGPSVPGLASLSRRPGRCRPQVVVPLCRADKPVLSDEHHTPGMGTKQRPADAGSQRARRIIIDLGIELRRTRQHHGLSQTAVGRAAGISPSQVSRIERGLLPRISIHRIARLMAVVGLELSVRAYPAGPPIRDAAHRALLDRFRARVGPHVSWRVGGPLRATGERKSGV